jgi:hypothetical protein
MEPEGHAQELLDFVVRARDDAKAAFDVAANVREVVRELEADGRAVTDKSVGDRVVERFEKAVAERLEMEVDNAVALLVLAEAEGSP